MRLIMPTAIVLAGLAAGALAQSPGPGAPSVDRWAGFLPGSLVRSQSRVTTSDGRLTLSSVTKNELKRFQGRNAVIEQSYEGSSGWAGHGQHLTAPPRLMEVPPDAPLFPGDGKVTGTGEGDVTVAGQVVHCRTIRWEGTSGGQPYQGEVWISDQVPGRLVQRRDTTPGRTNIVTAVMFEATRDEGRGK